MNAVEEKVLADQEERMLRDIDGLLLAAYNIYDVAKVIPHPYNAIGDMGNGFLHDYRNFAFTVQKYIERNRKLRSEA